MAHPNNSQHQKTQYFKKLQLRICVYCVEPAVDGQIRCQKHIDHYKAYQKKRRIERKARGVCAVCKEPAIQTIGGRTLCSKHILRAKAGKAKQVARHKELGLCRHCRNQAEPNKTMCAHHLEKLRENNKKRREKLMNMN